MKKSAAATTGSIHSAARGKAKITKADEPSSLTSFLPGALTEGAAHTFFCESSHVNQGNQNNLTLKSTITSVVSRESNQEIDLGAEVSCFRKTPFLFRRMIEKL